MVILGIIGLLGADFISKGFTGFMATDNRVAIYEEGKSALVRMEREIHNAVPNGVDSTVPTDIRFGMLDEGAMNIASSVFGIYQENPPTGTITDLTGPLAVNDIVSVYNRNWSDFTTTVASQRRLYTVTGIAGSTMTLSKNITPPKSSPRKRYYCVDRAVRYYLNGTDLLRSQLPINAENVDINTDLPAQPGFPLARNVSGLSFSFTPSSLVRNAMVTINFTITRGEETVNFHREVHIRNVP